MQCRYYHIPAPSFQGRHPLVSSTGSELHQLNPWFVLPGRWVIQQTWQGPKTGVCQMQAGAFQNVGRPALELCWKTLYPESCCCSCRVFQPSLWECERGKPSHDRQTDRPRHEKQYTRLYPENWVENWLCRPSPRRSHGGSWNE